MSPPEDSSVTDWVQKIQHDGDPTAVQKLWLRYSHRMERRAGVRLRGVNRGPADEQDVAQSAFAAFCQGAVAGRFPQLQDRHDLWRLLAGLIKHKATDVWRVERPKPSTSGGNGHLHNGRHEPAPVPDELIDSTPPPDVVVLFKEEIERLLVQLGDESLRAVATLKMEGHTNEEIAAILTIKVRAVERKLHLIRAIWKEEQ